MVLCNIPSIFILFIFLHLLQNVQTDIQQTKINKLDRDFFVWVHDYRSHSELFICYIYEHEQRNLMRKGKRGSINVIKNSALYIQNILSAYFTISSF